MLVMNKAKYRLATVAGLTLALAGNTWAAFTGGKDIGTQCKKKHLNSQQFSRCCSGGCVSIHPVSFTGGDNKPYNDCFLKCKTVQYLIE